MVTIKVLIVEDEPMTAEDIREYLSNSNYSVTAIAYNKEQALQALQKETPDLVLLDINLGGNMDGLALAQTIHEQHHTPFIFLTSYSHPSVLEQAKVTRPVGYILKPFDERDLYSSIEIGLYNFSQGARPRHISLPRINEHLHTPLTEKEFDILLSLYEGCTNKQMAEAHYVSVNTVKTHLKNLYDKLGVHSRSEVFARLRDWLGG